jgi:hypothetical protein
MKLDTNFPDPVQIHNRCDYWEHKKERHTKRILICTSIFILVIICLLLIL